MNYIDLAVLAVIVYYLYQGYRAGFFHLVLELFGMTLSLLVALFLYSQVGDLMAKILLLFKFKLSPIWSNPLGFFITWFAVESLFFTATHYYLLRRKFEFIGSKTDRAFSFLPAIFKGLIFSAIFLSLFVALPVEGSIKKAIFDSKIGSSLVRATDKLSASFDDVFGGAIKQSLNFVTIKPGSEETYDLGFTTTDVRPDEAAEQRMLTLINIERAKAGLKDLVLDKNIVPVARAHSVDMFAKGYFSHTNKEGLGPCERMKKAGLQFKACGENLAYAPDVDLAHRGLMNSPGHRANILSKDYTRVGIGIINADRYGEMFTQNFAG